MREAHPIERAVGIEYYVSEADGIGGRLRQAPEDFCVRELEAFDVEPIDADTGGYPELVCRVTLRDWDTNDFAGALSNAMGISRERVSWAGTKDKRAVTTQLFSIRNGTPDELPDLSDAEIEVLGRAGRPISFGDLAGNEFTIRVHDVADEAPSRITAITEDLHAFAGEADDDGTRVAGAESSDSTQSAQSSPSTTDSTQSAHSTSSTTDSADLGPSTDPVTVAVPNYFGQQRFGSRRPVTHEVGLAAIRGDWREAVRAYVANPFETEPERTRTARSVVAEQFDADDPDWGACLAAMPGHLSFERSMLHRLDERDVGTREGEAGDEDWRYALEAVPSNLQRLFVNAAQSFVFNRILSARLERGLPFDRPVAGDVVCFADADAPAGLVAPDTDRLQQVTADRVSIVARHCARGRAFVTAPLVGTETELGTDEPGEIERAVLSELDLDPADFDLPGEFESTGTRRAIMVRTSLSVTDVESAPVFEFALPSGSYATVLLREFLKSGPVDL